MKYEMMKLSYMKVSYHPQERDMKPKEKIRKIYEKIKIKDTKFSATSYEELFSALHRRRGFLSHVREYEIQLYKQNFQAQS